MAEMSATVRLDSQTLSRLKEIADKTDMSIARIASAAIEYALPHVKIEKKEVTVEVKTVVFK